MKYIITIALVAITTFSFSQDKEPTIDTTSRTYTKIVVGKDTFVKIIYTVKITDTLTKKKAREELQKVNESIKNNNESKIMRINAIQAEWKNLDAIYQERKLRLKAILAK